MVQIFSRFLIFQVWYFPNLVIFWRNLFLVGNKECFFLLECPAKIPILGMKNKQDMSRIKIPNFGNSKNPGNRVKILGIGLRFRGWCKNFRNRLKITDTRLHSRDIYGKIISFLSVFSFLFDSLSENNHKKFVFLFNFTFLFLGYENFAAF